MKSAIQESVQQMKLGELARYLWKRATLCFASGQKQSSGKRQSGLTVSCAEPNTQKEPNKLQGCR